MDDRTDAVQPRQNAIIFCPEHGKKCKAGHSSKVKTYFYCPVKGCKFSHHELRPAKVFPPSFHTMETTS